MNDDPSLTADEGTLPIGAPFRPGLDPLPARQHVWAVLKDGWGRPFHADPARALQASTAPVPALGPNDALGYVLYAGLTYNTIFAARGVPISVFDLHDRDLHVPGSGAVVVVAAVGSEVAREGRLKIGELRVLYPGVSNLLSPRAGEDPMHADFKIQGYETPDGSFAQFVRCQAPQLRGCRRGEPHTPSAGPPAAARHDAGVHAPNAPAFRNVNLVRESLRAT